MAPLVLWCPGSFLERMRSLTCEECLLVSRTDEHHVEDKRGRMKSFSYPRWHKASAQDEHSRVSNQARGDELECMEARIQPLLEHKSRTTVTQFGNKICFEFRKSEVKITHSSIYSIQKTRQHCSN